MHLFEDDKIPHLTVGEALAGLPPATEASDVAKRTAATILERQRKQDRTKWLKRRLGFTSAGQAAINSAVSDLAAFDAGNLGDMPMCCMAAVLELCRVSGPPNLADIVTFCVDHYLEDPPEKVRDALFVTGIRVLVTGGLLQQAESGAEVRYRPTHWDRLSGTQCHHGQAGELVHLTGLAADPMQPRSMP
jgi:hypothetical protein